MLECKICNRIFKNQRGFSSHLVQGHNINIKGYYDTYIKKEDEGFCLNCRKPTNFVQKGGYRYRTFCSSSCAYSYIAQNLSDEQKRKNATKAKQTRLERYGDKNYNNKEKAKETRSTWTEDKKQDIKAKFKQTCLEKYGVENVFQNEDIKEKIRQSNLEHFGVEYPQQDKSILEKRLKTNRERYGSNCPANHFCSSEPSIDEKKIIDNLNYNGTIISPAKNIIPYGYELDIYLPDLNLAIEFNGNYWHSIQNRKSNKELHLRKSLLCRNLGIRLIHIYEFEDFGVQMKLLNDLIEGNDNYNPFDFNKNNLLDSIPKSAIIYKNDRFIIYGAGKLYD